MRFSLPALTKAKRPRRRSSIRKLLVVLAVVPSLALAGLWGFTMSQLWSQTSELKDQNDIAVRTGPPAFTLMIHLQEERRLSAAWLAAPSEEGKTTLTAARGRTDAAFTAFTKLLDQVAGNARSDVVDQSRTVEANRDRLPGNRALIDRRDGSRQALLRPYTEVIDAQLATFATLSRIKADGRLTHRADNIITTFRAREMLARQDTVITYAEGIRKLGPQEYEDFAAAAGARNMLWNEQIPHNLEPEFLQMYQGLTAGGPWQAMTTAETAVLTAATRGPVANGLPLPPEAAGWRAALDQVNGQLAQFSVQRALALNTVSQDRIDDLEFAVWLITALGLAVIVVVSLLCWVITHSLRRRLLNLHRATVELAQQRLPSVIERLSRGEPVDAATELPALPLGNDEIGQVATAFATAQRAAVDGAVRLAREREGHTKVFHNVALRTQSLVGRQLRVLDAMENRHQDPEILQDLFVLDHLATRLRRYEENLVILSGHQPGRRWSKPVRIVDVIRSAVGEVEDYHRVDVHVTSDLTLTGTAVGAVIHLLAELVENATSFSPPDTPVEVRGTAVAKGVALEIEDRGLGMGQEEYDALNAELSQPNQFTMVALADEVRLGLFVVAQLAQRHNIDVTLRPSPYGGTLVIVFLPQELVMSQNAHGVPELRGGTDDAETAPEAPVVYGSFGDAAVLETAPDAGTAVRAVLASVSAIAPEDVSDAAASDTMWGEWFRAGQARPHDAGPADAWSPAPHPVPSAGYASDGHLPTADYSPEAGGYDSAEDTRTKKPLPRRVRQASLAAPLREAPADESDPAPTHPTPHQAAATVSAFQRASQRARAEDH